MQMSNNNRFAVNPPDVQIQRSKFIRNFDHKTTFNTGDLIPIFVDEVLPGDTFSVDSAGVVRMSTPIYPVMDNAYCDIYYFFVPNRLVWNHWREFYGENRETAWEQPVDYEIPQITAPEKGWQKGTIADYMGIPINVSGLSVSALPFRAYVLIWNEWFRDQNLKDPAMVNLDDATVQGANDGDYVANAQLGALPLKVAKPHDLFTSCLPEPQKGPAVLLPIGSSAPVLTSTSPIVTGAHDPMKLSPIDGTSMPSSKTTDLYAGGADGNVNGREITSTPPFEYSFYPSNLYADLSEAQAATVNQLRLSFAVQRLYEKRARGGSRYIEQIKALFGVDSPDSRLQRPEYLGGSRIPISMNQVLQTSGTTDVSPQGNTAAYSQTNFNENSFTKSFTEHGYIIGLACVRTSHTYQQGIERFWSRKKFFDFYVPQLANIGEVAVLNKEIYAQGTATDDEAFGYQEAWADYRYKPSRVSGAFRSTYAQSLDAWHYADYYESQPFLSSEWIDETRENMNRTLAVQDTLEDQFIADFYFGLSCVRPMPLYSIPGLIDHF